MAAMLACLLQEGQAVLGAEVSAARVDGVHEIVALHI